ncbi:MAG: hypothetical protein AAF349_03905 [Cyanobacteria bacterium P01_A01_bin.68]
MLLQKFLSQYKAQKQIKTNSLDINRLLAIFNKCDRHYFWKIIIVAFAT